VVLGLKEGLEQLKDEYDFVIIDCLPLFGHMHLAALIAADYVLILVKPSSLWSARNQGFTRYHPQGKGPAQSGA